MQVGDQSPTDWAYLAGVIDSDGSISIVTQNSGRPQLQPRVSVVMSTEEPVRWIHETFPIGRFSKKWHEQRGVSPSGYRWRWGAYSFDGAWWICQGVLPYLRLKIDKAKEVIDLADLKREAEDV